MSIRILTDEQRRQYGRFAGTPSADELARHFHLDAADQEAIGQLRGDHNRLGFALMLGCARFLGAFPHRAADVPAPVLDDLARQLDLDGNVTLDVYFGSRQRKRHLAQIRAQYRFREFVTAGMARFRLARWLYTLCWTGDDRPALLFERAVAWLIANKVLRPGATVLERFVGQVRDRAEKRLWTRLVAALDDTQRKRIAALFDETDIGAFAALDALRTVPRRRSQEEFWRHLDRLDAIRAFNLRPTPPGGVPVATIERLARVARSSKPSAISDLKEPRRTATVAALFLTLEAAAQDDAAELAEALITDLVKDAEADHKKARLRTLHDLDAAALLLASLGRLTLAEDDLPADHAEWRAALFETIPRQSIEDAITEVEARAKPRDARPYEELLARWRSARRLFANVAARIETDAAPGGQAVRNAMAYLKGKANWSSVSMRDAPTTAIPKPWRKLVLDGKGQVANPQAYVFAIIDAWRAALKRRDLFTRPGIRYGDPRRGLLDGKAWESSRLMVCRALGRSLDADDELGALAGLLDAAFRKVAASAGSNPDFRIETVNGKPEIKVDRLDRLEEPDSLRLLRPAVAARMPRADVPDVVLEVMAKTGFDQAFTHLSERQARVDDFRTSLCATLIAQACNTGYQPMIRQDIPALRRARLSWVDQNFMRPETIADANAVIVAAHDALPIASLWGDGQTASADGIRFTAPVTAIHAGSNPKYFGHLRGLTWYNLVSNQFSGLGGIVVPGTLRDSLLLLALLLQQQTGLSPVEVMTDTAAYSDAVFALFWLLGYQFSPRLADIGGARLWRIDRHADYGALNDIATGVIRLDLIREHWEDLIRLAGSLKLGHLQAAGVMRTLQVKDKPTTLARALSELGRIVKTLHILRYVDDKEFRRRILVQLNRQELRHRLGRRMFHGDRGEIRSPLRLGQQEQLGAFDFTLNAIAHWNAIYMQAVLDQLEREGWSIDDVDVARLSPLIWRHINFLGRYSFNLPEAVALGDLRPLRDPNSEEDF